MRSNLGYLTPDPDYVRASLRPHHQNLLFSLGRQIEAGQLPPVTLLIGPPGDGASLLLAALEAAHGDRVVATGDGANLSSPQRVVARCRQAGPCVLLVRRLDVWLERQRHDELRRMRAAVEAGLPLRLIGTADTEPGAVSDVDQPFWGSATMVRTAGLTPPKVPGDPDDVLAVALDGRLRLLAMADSELRGFRLTDLDAAARAVRAAADASVPRLWLDVADMSETERWVLTALVELGQPANQQFLLRTAQLTPSTGSRALSALEGRSIVTRYTSPAGDARRKLVELADPIWSLMAQARGGLPLLQARLKLLGAARLPAYVDAADTPTQVGEGNEWLGPAVTDLVQWLTADLRWGLYGMPDRSVGGQTLDHGQIPVPWGSASGRDVLMPPGAAATGYGGGLMDLEPSPHHPAPHAALLSQLRADTVQTPITEGLALLVALAGRAVGAIDTATFSELIDRIAVAHPEGPLHDAALALAQTVLNGTGPTDVVLAQAAALGGPVQERLTAAALSAPDDGGW